MVRKPDNSWRMCIDFKDLNKACPKDCYPLPEIDLKVDSLSGYPFKCFLDAYKGYHQILMKEEDEEKTAFHTDKGIFCYQKMPFGLKNAGATCQRLVDKAFETQIGRNMEGKFLGHIVGKQSIKANPNKVRAVLEAKPLKTKKKVESLNGKLVALKLFTSKLAERSLPFFKTLKGCTDKKDFKWTEEAEEAFNQMKQHLTSLPDMAAPETGELISVYLSVPEEAISAVLTIERDKIQTTNNEAEYEALIAGLRLAKEMKVQKLEVFTDSLLVLVEVLKASSIDELEVQDVIAEEDPNWMTPIKKFLKNGELPNDQTEAERFKIKARQYVLQGETLYKKGYLVPLLRCVGPEQSQYLVKEVHEGICGAHFGARSVVAKLMNLGYFWPSMHRDTTKLLRKCDACQIHAPVPKSPKHDLVPITSAWPFYKWGMDIVGQFPPSKAGVKFLFVAIDYFTKWPEVKPLAKITGKQIIDFVWENIICYYGLPGVLVTDNGKQFAEKPFSVWCKEYKINQVFSSVAYPQSNGQVERTNRSILEG
ncbi:uncharacterized protein LOC110944716 [Helianthus annuus]|uniref:uncharacterized protein LOC110944716 n=1 Tax=Helianthus annuus TaxID=4232 RepID=UPI000B8F2269|nr:uncharacterized protein LOC110944716 [Helianthus annuus]